MAINYQTCNLSCMGTLFEEQAICVSTKSTLASVELIIHCGAAK